MCAFFIVHSFFISGFIVKDLDNCSPAYWPVYILPFLFYGTITVVLAKRNVRLHEEKVAANYPFAKGDIQWTPQVALRMVPAAVGAGVAAGLLGIGGGMILGPLFVALNFQPQAISPA